MHEQQAAVREMRGKCSRLAGRRWRGLTIPKFDRGSFFPEVLEPRRRIDQALYAVVMEAYVNGVSTRSVDNLVAVLGVDTSISKSEVPRICRALDERVAAFRNRTLGHTTFPYTYQPQPLPSKRRSASRRRACDGHLWTEEARLRVPSGGNTRYFQCSSTNGLRCTNGFPLSHEQATVGLASEGGIWPQLNRGLLTARLEDRLSSPIDRHCQEQDTVADLQNVLRSIAGEIEPPVAINYR
jgi:hypothetical protein